MRYFQQVVAGMLATSLVAGPCIGGMASAQEAKGAQEVTKVEAPEASAEQPQEQNASESKQAVEEAVQKTTDDATAERREKLIEDAVEALDETKKALKALEEGDTEAAIDSLALATGKLDLVVARNPRLAIAPVDIRLVTNDLFATVEDVEKARKEALEKLERGRVQDARLIIEGLRSDVVVEVMNLPLATYPSAIKAITPLIDDDRIEAAKNGLQQILNTLVVTQYVHPLPIIRTQHMLTRAEELATAEERSQEQNEELERLLDGARKQLEFAQALGYGKKKDFEGFYEQLDEITRKTSGGKSGTGLFDKIRSALRSFGKSSSEANES